MKYFVATHQDCANNSEDYCNCPEGEPLRLPEIFSSELCLVGMDTARTTTRIKIEDRWDPEPLITRYYDSILRDFGGVMSKEAKWELLNDVRRVVVGLGEVANRYEAGTVLHISELDISWIN